MDKLPPVSPPNAYQFSLRQMFLWMHIVAVACSAFVGMGQIIVGNFTEFRILSTAMIVALASACALCCGAALESKRAKVFPFAGLVLTLLGTLMLLIMVWNISLQNRSWEKYFILMTIVCIYAVACSHISLLSIARLSVKFRWAQVLAVISIIAVASLLTALFVIPSPQQYGTLFPRLIAVAAIFDAAMSVLIPVFHLLSYREAKNVDAGIDPTLLAIDAEIADLESRLIKLRQLRMEKSSGSYRE